MAERSWGAPVDGIAVAIALDQARYPVGVGVELKLWVRNVGTQPRTIVLAAPLAVYRLRLRTETGGELDYSDYGKGRVRTARGLSKSVEELAPGREIADVENLHRVFDLAPGRYLLRAERAIYSGTGPEMIGTAISNELALEITPER